jgi:hypothetical protein
VSSEEKLGLRLSCEEPFDTESIEPITIGTRADEGLEDIIGISLGIPAELRLNVPSRV